MQPPATGTPDRVLLVSIVDINRDYLTRLAGGDQELGYPPGEGPAETIVLLDLK